MGEKEQETLFKACMAFFKWGLSKMAYLLVGSKLVIYLDTLLWENSREYCCLTACVANRPIEFACHKCALLANMVPMHLAASLSQGTQYVTTKKVKYE